MSLKRIMILTLLVLNGILSDCSLCRGQTGSTSPDSGLFQELAIPGPDFQPLIAIGKTHLVTGAKSLGETSITLFDLATGEKRKNFKVGELNPPLALSQDGKTLAGFPKGFQKDKLVLVDTATGQAVFTD